MVITFLSVVILSLSQIHPLSNNVARCIDSDSLSADTVYIVSSVTLCDSCMIATEAMETTIKECVGNSTKPMKVVRLVQAESQSQFDSLRLMHFENNHFYPDIGGFTNRLLVDQIGDHVVALILGETVVEISKSNPTEICDQLKPIKDRIVRRPDQYRIRQPSEGWQRK